MLTANDKTEILERVEAGLGRHSAVRAVGKTLGEFREALVADREFLDAIRLLEGTLVDQAMLQVYSHAMESPAAAAEYVRLTRSRKLDAVKVRLARKQIAIQSRAVDDQVARSGPSLDFRRLTDDEFRRYAALHGRLRQGESLPAADAVQYAALTAKIASAPAAPVAPPPLGGNGFHVKSIEEMFDDDEDD